MRIEQDLIPRGDYKVSYIIDGGIAYQLGYAQQHITDENTLINNVKNFIVNNIFKRTKNFNGQYIFVMDSQHNFRKDDDETYKENRKDKEKPIWLNTIRNFLTSKGSISVDGLEADDIAGIIHTCYEKLYREGKVDFRTCPVSADKDWNQFSGHRLVPTRTYKGEEKANYFMYIEPDEAERYLWKQVLIGDRVDNIKKIFTGKGEAWATKIIEKEPILGRLYDVVLEQYIEHLTPEINKEFEPLGIIPETLYVRNRAIKELKSVFDKVYLHRDNSRLYLHGISTQIDLPINFKVWKG